MEMLHERESLMKGILAESSQVSDLAPGGGAQRIEGDLMGGLPTVEMLDERGSLLGLDPLK